MIYFTSDTHFSHKNILKLGKGRPFQTIQEHNEALIENWNSKVKETDIIYHLGDFCWNQNSEQIRSLMKKLKGIKYLIYGNHDRLVPNRQSGCWMEIVPYKELFIDNKQLVLFHYPICDWHGAFRKSIHLHGHIHDTFDYKVFDFPHKNKRIFNVGVDVNNFTPISLDEIFEKAKE